MNLNYDKGGLQKSSYNKDEVVERACPLCKGNNYVKIYQERGALGIVRCKDCSFIYTNPMVKEPEKNYWGDEKKYYEEARLIFEGTAKSHRDPNYMQDLRIIESIKPQGTFLDIGTNMGFFLRCARGRKWNIFGVEPSPALSGMARDYFNLNVKTAYFENAGFQDNFFDIITMTDVFEHIAEPKKMLFEIRKKLKSDGILFIKVPNGNYSRLKLKIAKVFGQRKNYDIFDSYEHLAHYTSGTLKRVLSDCGFKIEKILIGKPIQLPVWHKYVGHFYLYPSPWALDPINQTLRLLFYWISRIEFLLRFNNIGYFAPNIIMIAAKK